MSRALTVQRTSNSIITLSGPLGLFCHAVSHSAPRHYQVWGVTYSASQTNNRLQYVHLISENDVTPAANISGSVHNGYTQRLSLDSFIEQFHDQSTLIYLQAIQQPHLYINIVLHSWQLFYVSIL